MSLRQVVANPLVCLGCSNHDCTDDLRNLKIGNVSKSGTHETEYGAKDKVSHSSARFCSPWGKLLLLEMFPECLRAP